MDPGENAAGTKSEARSARFGCCSDPGGDQTHTDQRKSGWFGSLGIVKAVRRIVAVGTEEETDGADCRGFQIGWRIEPEDYLIDHYRRAHKSRLVEPGGVADDAEIDSAGGDCTGKVRRADEVGGVQEAEIGCADQVSSSGGRIGPLTAYIVCAVRQVMQFLMDPMFAEALKGVTVTSGASK